MQAPLILLAEDEPVIALHLQLKLEEMGYQVITVPNAEETIKLCAQHLPDLIILNFWMKAAEDGVALARHIRSQYPVKIVFITGSRSQDFELSGQIFSNHHVLFKPFTKQQLISFLLHLDRKTTE